MPAKNTVEKSKSEPSHLNPVSPPAISNITPTELGMPLASSTGINPQSVMPRHLPALQRNVGNQAVNRIVQAQSINHAPNHGLQAPAIIQRVSIPPATKENKSAYRVGREGEWIEFSWKEGEKVSDLQNKCNLRGTIKERKNPAGAERRQLPEQYLEEVSLIPTKVRLTEEKIVKGTDPLVIGAVYAAIPLIGKEASQAQITVLSSLSRLARSFGKEQDSSAQEAQAMAVDGKIVLTGNTTAETQALGNKIGKGGATAEKLKSDLRTLYAGITKHKSNETSEDAKLGANEKDLRIVEDWIDENKNPDKEDAIFAVNAANSKSAADRIDNDSVRLIVLSKGQSSKLKEDGETPAAGTLEDDGWDKDWHAEQKLLVVLTQRLKELKIPTEVTIAGTKYPCTKCTEELHPHEGALAVYKDLHFLHDEPGYASVAGKDYAKEYTASKERKPRTCGVETDIKPAHLSHKIFDPEDMSPLLKAKQELADIKKSIKELNHLASTKKVQSDPIRYQRKELQRQLTVKRKAIEKAENFINYLRGLAGKEKFKHQCGGQFSLEKPKKSPKLEASSPKVPAPTEGSPAITSAEVGSDKKVEGPSLPVVKEEVGSKTSETAKEEGGKAPDVVKEEAGKASGTEKEETSKTPDAEEEEEEEDEDSKASGVVEEEEPDKEHPATQ